MPRSVWPGGPGAAGCRNAAAWSGVTRWGLPGILVMLACLSCTRLETVPLVRLDADDLLGRPVRVTTTDGRVLEFTVETVTDDALIGATERVGFGEIAHIERREVSVLGTAGVVAGVIAVTVAAGFVVLLAQWLGALGST